MLLGDDLIDPRDPLLPDDDRGARAVRRAASIALMEVPPEQINLYGCAAVARGRRRAGRRTRHRPGREAAGRRGAEQPRRHRPLPARPVGVRRAADDRSPDRGGEIQLTDALQHLAVGSQRRGPACAAWCSAVAATTPATGWSTSRPSCGWPASTRSSARSFRSWLDEFAGRGSRSTSRGHRGDLRRGAPAPDPRHGAGRSRRSDVHCSSRRRTASSPRTS